MDGTPNDQRKAIITFAAILIIIVIIVAAVAASPKKKAGMVSTDSSTSTTTTDDPTSTNSSFKDGDYTATGSYVSPGGNQHLTVDVTLKNGVITDTSATSGAQDPTSEEYQGNFIDGYKSLVVGKNITSVNLSRVSGSSLTSQGFNNALNQIKNQASA